MNMYKNFELNEFKCKCGCGKVLIHPILLDRLQLIANKYKKPVYINSGYRCAIHDKAVGGDGVGAHTMGIAADIHIDGVSSWDIAKTAETLGFGGIGIITQNDIHLDIRDLSGYDVAGFTYANNKWYGNEMTGETYSTFI